MFPYLFEIGGFQIRVYSIMYLVSVLIALYFARQKSKKMQINPNYTENIVIFAFLGGILGARIYYVLFKWGYYSKTPWEIIAIWHGGLAIHGGIIGGVITAYFVGKHYGIKLFTFGDIILPFLLLGQGIGRFGNFANGEAHGVPVITPPSIIFKMQNIFPEFWQKVLNTLNLTNTPEGMNQLAAMIDKNKEIFINFQGKMYELKEYVPWGISFPPKYNPPAYQEFGTLAVHPTFFYEMILNFIFASILIYFWKNDKNIGKGFITGLYLIFYGIIRFFVSFFRADDLMMWMFRAPHVASFVMIIIGLSIISIKRRSV